MSLSLSTQEVGRAVAAFVQTSLCLSSLLSGICTNIAVTCENAGTLQWSLIRRQALEIRKLSPFRSAPQIRPAPHFVACRCIV